MRSEAAQSGGFDRRAIRAWRRVLLAAVLGAVALIVSTVAAGVLAEFSAFGIDRHDLRMQILWPLVPALAVLVVLAASAALRLVQLMPNRSLFSVRDSVWFAAVCALLVLMPSAILLERWAELSGPALAFRVIQLLELMSQGITLVLLMRAAHHAWYADCESLLPA